MKEIQCPFCDEALFTDADADYCIRFFVLPDLSKDDEKDFREFN